MKMKYAIIICLLLLPMIGWGQSEVTHRMTAAEAGYRGPVRQVLTRQTGSLSGPRRFLVQAETFNATGLRTGIVTVDSLGRFYTACRYTPDGRLTRAVCGFPLGREIITFRHNSLGCPVSCYSERYSSEGDGGHESTLFRLECDDHCRLLLYLPPWGDSSIYRYDTKGRLVYRALPGAEDYYYYDARGRLVRQRSGWEHYIDQHFRYDDRGNLTETWHTDWETGGSVSTPSLEHIRYRYTRYDRHGNWTHALMCVELNGQRQFCTLVRTIDYYD